MDRVQAGRGLPFEVPLPPENWQGTGVELFLGKLVKKAGKAVKKVVKSLAAAIRGRAG